MESVGTKALLITGKTTGRSERLLAPAGVLATSPKATASQVRASVTGAVENAQRSPGTAGNFVLRFQRVAPAFVF